MEVAGEVSNLVFFPTIEMERLPSRLVFFRGCKPIRRGLNCPKSLFPRILADSVGISQISAGKLELFLDLEDHKFTPDVFVRLGVFGFL
jgi:hypothetical protein